MTDTDIIRKYDIYFFISIMLLESNVYTEHGLMGLRIEISGHFRTI